MSGHYSVPSSGSTSNKSFDSLIPKPAAAPSHNNKHSVSTSQVTYLRTQASSVVSSSSLIVKIVCCAIIIGYFVSFSSQALTILTVLPGNLIPPNFWVWTCITHSFIERHWWMVVCDIVVIILYAKLLEPLWGTLETVRFYFLITISISILTALTYLTAYLLTSNTDYLFKQYIHGLAGYLAAFAVAVKQSMSDHVLVSTPFGKLRNCHVPLWVLLAAIVVRVCGGVDPPFPVMFAWGLIVSWIYLRFYQRHHNGNRGDMADSFSFASFFPDPMRPILSVVSNTVFNLLVTLHVCSKQTSQRLGAISPPMNTTQTLPTLDIQDSERRRQVALKALNERLTKTPATNWSDSADNKSLSLSSKSEIVANVDSAESAASKAAAAKSVSADDIAIVMPDT